VVHPKETELIKSEEEVISQISDFVKRLPAKR